MPEKDQLRPITRWKEGLEFLDCLGGPACGTVTISDPKMGLTTVRELRMETASNELAPCPSSSAVNRAVTQIVDTPLVYTSGPVKLSGLLVCPDGDRSLTVNLALTGGWIAVIYQADVPDSGKGTHQLVNWVGTRNWNVVQP